MRIAAVAGAIAMLGVAATVQASGLGFMSKGPLARFNEADMKLFNSAIEKAREADDQSAPVEWANEKSGSSGSVAPLRTFEDAGRTCRDLKVINRHKQLESSGVYVMCRTKDGRWQWKQ